MKTHWRSRSSRVTAMILAFMMTLVFIPTFSFASYAAEEDEGITVYMTVSDQGVIAKANDGSPMAWKEVSVTDINGDEHYTFDEALVAAHAAYNSPEGFGVTSSGWVTNVWGKTGTGYSFTTNDVAFSDLVTDAEIADGDYLMASINKDATADWVSFFDCYSDIVTVGESYPLNLSGYPAMTQNAPVAGSGVQIGLWNDGTFEAIEGAVTDENGDVSLVFDEPGRYLITAQGAVLDRWDATETYQLQETTKDAEGETIYGKMDWNTYDSFVGYTEEDYGEGPYPWDEIKWINLEDFEAETFADGHLLYSGEIEYNCPIMAPACVITVDPAPLDYDGEEVNFIKEDGSQFGMFTPQEGTTAKLEGEDLIIHYVPKNKTVYSGFSWGSIALPDYTDEAVQPGPDVEFNEDGTFDLILDISDCGTAYPIAVIKKSFGKGSWTSADQYYLAIPTSDHFIAADYSAVDAAIAKVPKDMSKYTDASVKAVNDAVKAVVRGKMANEQAAVDNMAKAINNAVAGLKAKEVKKGWKKENGSWYYYNNDGTAAKNTWKKDSKGWCYLGSDGKMVANGWAKDSKGTVWMNGSGYWDTSTKWIKSGGNWYHITKGYMDTSKWMKDSKGWCYLGKDGKMVTNGWAKDSHGWCWMGSNGYWTSNKWVKDKGEWYYIKSNHYMASNEWAKDSKGWMYMAGNGKVTKSKWVKSGGDWYYLKDNGYMATGTLKIGSKTYRFNSAGKWIQ